jgi:hypothetical protein
MVSPTPDPSPPVVMYASDAVWEMTRVSDGDPPLIVAELHLMTGNMNPTPAAHRVVATRWRLEEHLGFALPEGIYQTLLQTPGRVGAEKAPVASPPSGPAQAQWRPTRASPVLLADGRFTTYGRLRHEDSPARVWEHAGYRIEIVKYAYSRVELFRQVSFRLWYDSAVMLADQAIVTVDLDDDDLLRDIVEMAMAVRPTEDLTTRQQEFITSHGQSLRKILAPPAAPYPAGTRVSLFGQDGGAPVVTAVVVDTMVDETGARWYGVRPEVSRLPGHPLRRHPDSFLVFSEDDITPTLRPPSTGIEAVLSYGARVRTIDHPTVAMGTVLRAFSADEDPLYEIQPDNSATPPITLSARDIQPLAGTLWQTIDALVGARAAAELPLQPKEILVSLDNFAVVKEGPAGPVVHRGPGLRERDPMFGEIWASSSVLTEPPGATSEAYLELGEAIVVHDPVHVFLAAPAPLFGAALRRSPEELAGMVNAVPGIEVTGTEPFATLAALAAMHSPRTLDPAWPPNPTQPEPPPPMDIPPP